MLNNNFIKTIAEALASKGIDSYYVGGCVRDAHLGIESDDIDVCLTGATSLNFVERVLWQFSDSIVYEGKNFPVWIVKDSNGEKYDFALARKERKSGETRTDFDVLFGPEITIEEDLYRRDITVNAVAVNVLTGQVIDPFGGLSDLDKKSCRAVSPAFADDTLRVQRAARFCARYGLVPDEVFLAMCRKLKPTDISNERVGMELKKLFEQSDKPSTFFRFLKSVDWLKYHFVELNNLVGVQQNPEYHPEGDAFEHTMHCMDAANTPFMRCVMMCHDLGKASTTMYDGAWKAPGHAKAGIKPTYDMLGRISYKDGKYQDKVACLVENHMFHVLPEFSRKAVGRMIKKLDTFGLSFDDLVEVCRCDIAGRPPLPATDVYIGQDLAEELMAANCTVRVVNGSMLMEKGYVQGRELGHKLAELEELQLEGKLNSDNWESFL